MQKYRVEIWLAESPPLEVIHVFGTLECAKKTADRWAKNNGCVASEDWWIDPHPSYGGVWTRNYSINNAGENDLRGTTAYIFSA